MLTCCNAVQSANSLQPATSIRGDEAASESPSLLTAAAITSARGQISITESIVRVAETLF